MTGPDRADEMRAMPDLWPVIADHLDAARNDADLSPVLHYPDAAELEAKFRAGEWEHGRDWLDMTRADLEREIRAEVMDLVLYHAMIRARWATRTAPAFLMHRDPGDEQPGA
jgi:hypothetical protein